MPQLIVKNGQQPAETFPITRLPTTIGRSARSDVCIPDAFASRPHAEVRQEGEAFWLQDLGSANGTCYNGNLVTVPLRLFPDAELQIRETLIACEGHRCARRNT